MLLFKLEMFYYLNIAIFSCQSKTQEYNYKINDVLEKWIVKIYREHHWNHMEEK